jgi:hypothetical protein
VKRLTCYRIHERTPRLVPGRADRAWMDATDKRYAYRCLPLSIANSMGWEILTPARVVAEWNGDPGLSDIAIAVDDGWQGDQFASSHFGHGIMTFQTGYLFRTDPGVAIWARGAPNWSKGRYRAARWHGPPAARFPWSSRSRRRRNSRWIVAPVLSYRPTGYRSFPGSFR